jgi:hypothetical protein
VKVKVSVRELSWLAVMLRALLVVHNVKQQWSGKVGRHAISIVSQVQVRAYPGHNLELTML